MSRKVLIPPGAETAAETAKMSPGILSDTHVFVTGMTGSAPDGTMPRDAEEQFRAAFAKIAAVLAQAELTFEAVVEMTSYHVGLQEHFALFDAVRQDLFSPPYSAWTAVEVAGLRRAGALVEVRVIACTS